jgi:hypothetical protein
MLLAEAELVLFIDRYVLINRWCLTKQNTDNQPPTQHVIHFQYKDDEDPLSISYEEEVIMFNNNSDSPLCSILCSDKVTHHVLDLDWPGFNGGNHK